MGFLILLPRQEETREENEEGGDSLGRSYSKGRGSRNNVGGGTRE